MENTMESPIDITQIAIGSGKPFTIPDALLIDPAQIYDEKQGLYRVSIGKPDMPCNEYCQYLPLYAVLQEYNDTFINKVKITSGDKIIELHLVFVTMTVKPFGLFFDLESQKIKERKKKV